jgi:ribosome recycling factor
MSARSTRRSARPVSASIRSSTARRCALPIPDLTEERRKELAKLANQYAEKARIAVRNVRRDGNDSLKTDEKKGLFGEDERKRHETEVQKLTDSTIADIDAAAAAKEKEILGK